MVEVPLISFEDHIWFHFVCTWFPSTSLVWNQKNYIWCLYDITVIRHNCNTALHRNLQLKNFDKFLKSTSLSNDFGFRNNWICLLTSACFCISCFFWLIWMKALHIISVTCQYKFFKAKFHILKKDARIWRSCKDFRSCLKRRKASSTEL